MTTDKHEIKQYADGWISERKGTDVPRFLKVAYLVIGLGAIVYLVRMKQGEITNATRGVLVQQLNMTTGTADALMFGVAALALVGLGWLAAFSFRKPHDD